MVKKKINDIGSFLRKLRFDNNETQEDMASKLGVTPAYISLLEFRQPITKKMALKIIKTYSLSDKDKDVFVNMITNDIVKRFWGGN